MADWFPPPEEGLSGLPAWTALILWLGGINAIVFAIVATWRDQRPIVGGFRVAVGVAAIGALLLWRKRREQRHQNRPSRED